MIDEKTVFAEKIAEYILDEVEDSRTLEEAKERVRKVVMKFRMKSSIEIAEMLNSF